MGRFLSWGANSLLFVLCCYLVANTVNEVFAALLTPTADAVVAAVAPASTDSREMSDRRIILQRNLFNSSMLAPPPPPEVEVVIEEDLEATKLPLTLLGTAAGDSPEFSWAAVSDKSINDTVVVGIGQSVNTAEVKRIERRRIVLLENGVLRELVLDEDAARAVAPKPRQARAKQQSPRARRRAAARNRAAKRRGANARGAAAAPVKPQAARNPAALLAEGRIQPKYEDEEMVGLEVNQVDPGSVLEEIGIQAGDVITQLNGVAINEDQDPNEMLSNLTAEGGPVPVGIDRADGSNETLYIDLEQ